MRIRDDHGKRDQWETTRRVLRYAPPVLLPLLIVSAVAAAASSGCATTGHTGALPDDDDGSTPGGASAASSTPPTGDASAESSTPPRPPAPGLSLFGQSCEAGAPAVDWSPLRRISRVEYDHMVRDLLGDTTQPANAFPPESPLTLGVNFEANTYEGTSSLIVQDYLQAAETLAETAVSSPNRLSSILPCQTQDDACAKQFIATWVNRAFRGQLDDTESASLLQLYSDAKAQFDFATGVQAVITATLESPRFLYVVEFGNTAAASGDVVPLSSYEVAARLALFLWRSVPDAALMQAAASGQLSTAAQVQAQATRMLADPKAQDALNDFATQWMQLQSTATLGKDTQFTAWNSPNYAKLGAELVDETLTNYSQEVQTGGDLVDLLTSTKSYINSNLAQFYGTATGNPAIAIGSGTKVTVNDSSLSDTNFVQTAIPHRAGILTNGSVLATQAHTTLPSSVLRGKLVREQVLCDTIPPPPPTVPPPASSLGDAGTTRALLEAHFTQPGCVSCHEYMDPIGLGFGFFDATGAYQATDANGQTNPPPGGFPAVDATGQIKPMSTTGLSTNFDGATDLASKLAAAEQTRQCFALQEFRYAFGRVEDKDDVCSLQQIYSSFSASNLKLNEVLVALVASDAFRYRSLENPGSECR